MKKSELIKALEAIPGDPEVLNYIEEAEEYGRTSKVELKQPTDPMPYAKADVPRIDEPTVLVSGWIA